MGYTNETTHYGIPLPLGSDLTTPMDYNEAFEDVDRDLFANTQAVTQTTGKVNDLEVALSATNDEVTAVKGRVATLEGTVSTQGNAITQLQLDVADTKADALDMICAVDEGTAQVATVAVQEGKYFRYNDVLYIATDDIAIGDTIVPNTNCRATNVATELEGSTSTLEGRVSTLETEYSSLDTRVDTLETSTSGTEVAIAGDTDYTCPADGYVTAYSGANATDYVTLNVNTHAIGRANGTGSLAGRFGCYVRKGSVVKITGSGTLAGNFIPFA